MSHHPAAPPAAQALRAQRIGERTYVGRSSSGAEVQIGPEGTAGSFSPGELLALAVAGCAGMSADGRLSASLGEHATVTVAATRIPELGATRYQRIEIELMIDASDLPQERRTRLLEALPTAIERHCTVSRTIVPGTDVTVTITDEG